MTDDKPAHNHNDPEGLPEFLCRHCHPELSRTPKQLAEADAADRKEARRRRAADSRASALRSAEYKLAGLLRNGEPAADSVSGKITASMRKKVNRLRKKV